jgi:hypothetical protein
VRIRRKISVIAPLLLLLGALTATSPTSVAAFSNTADPDGNPWTASLAGRPVNGFSYNSDAPGTRPKVFDSTDCTYKTNYGMGHGIMYGKINNNIVLYYPWHGMNHSCAINKYVYGPNGSIIGAFWGMGDANGSVCVTTWGCSGSDHDLGVIRLFDGNWPSNLNQIYRGEATGENWWTITQGPYYGLRCAIADTETGLTIYQNYQKTYATNTIYRTGTNGTRIGDNYDCDVTTTIDSTDKGCTETATVHCERSSGTPFISAYNPATISGFASYKNGNEDLVINPFYEGLKAIDGWWDQQYGSYATICTNSGCTN